MKRSRSVSLLNPVGGVTRKAMLVPIALAAATTLSGCNEYATLEQCEARNGAGACMQEPQPTMMTDDNRPSYVLADSCMKDFGEEQCVESERHGVRAYRPLYTPGQTYFYPQSSGYTGYYQGSMTTTPGKYQFTSRYGFGGSARAFGAPVGG